MRGVSLLLAVLAAQVGALADCVRLAQSVFVAESAALCVDGCVFTAISVDDITTAFAGSLALDGPGVSESESVFRVPIHSEDGQLPSDCWVDILHHPVTQIVDAITKKDTRVDRNLITIVDVPGSGCGAEVNLNGSIRNSKHTQTLVVAVCFLQENQLCG